MSWIYTAGGYRLFCNRDEKRTRLPAIAPKTRRLAGVRILAPVDGDHGGTWLSVNEYGVAICLLNGACLSMNHEPPNCETPAQMQPRNSRGCIPLMLANSRSSQQACERLSGFALASFPAFTVLMAEPGLPVAIAEWNGTELAILPYGEPFLPLVSSSFEAASVRAWRQQEFRRFARPEDFHRSHNGGASAFSPCMHREDAETVSHSEVSVTANQVTFLYSAGLPCRSAPPEKLCLTLIP
ncbi:MAG: NRDE family protein [Bryobacterales bacterium]|nr:NRDE family protein [Bryobacterales bacterium]